MMLKLNRKLWACLLLCFFLLMLTSFIENGGKFAVVSVYCPNEMIACDNPFFRSFNIICEDSPELCEIEYIQPGETIGTTPGVLTKSVPVFSLALLVIGILLEVFLRRKKENENPNNKQE